MAERVYPAYLLAGDSFLTQTQFETLSAEIAKSFSGEVLSRRVFLSETPLDTILKEARTLPFLVSAQIFRLQNAEVLKEKQLEPLAAYLAHPSETAFLIFESADLEKDSALVETLLKKGKVFWLEAADKKNAGLRFVREKAREAGKTLGPEALSKLEELAGTAPVFLETFINQLILYSGAEKEITPEMIAAFGEDWQETDVFKFIEALGAKRLQESIYLLKRVIKENEDGDLLSLVGLLHWQIRRLWQAKMLLEEGMPQSMVEKKCRISPKQAPFIMRQLKAYSLSKLEKVLEGLFQLDWAIKTGRAEDESGLEKWVIQTTA